MLIGSGMDREIPQQIPSWEKQIQHKKINII